MLNTNTIRGLSLEEYGIETDNKFAGIIVVNDNNSYDIEILKSNKIVNETKITSLEIEVINLNATNLLLQMQVEELRKYCFPEKVL
jgi:hypothetical protein